MNILDERFDYVYSITNRLLMPSQFINTGNKKIKISLLVTNGFVKIYTLKGRIYWIQQSRSENKIPDWKIHFNINHADIPKAWNIIYRNFLCRKIKHTKEEDIIDDVFICLKTINTNLQKNFPEYMHGREITVNKYKYHKLLNEKNGDGIETNYENEEGKTVNITLKYTKKEEENFEFWKEYLIDTENKLLKENIRTQKKNGAAEGDLFLGKYCSLRNEEFYCDEYPPNECGWNITKGKEPFNFYQIFLLRYYLVYKDRILFKNIYIISLIILLIGVIAYFLILY